MHDQLTDLIRNHTAAHLAWRNSVPPADDLPCEGELYDAFCAAELAFIKHQCASHDEVQQKLSHVAATPIVAEVIETDFQDEFLASLRLPPMAGVTSALAEAIGSWQRASDLFQEAVARDANEHDALWHAMDNAEAAMIAEPCCTTADIRAKIEIALNNGNVFDSLASATYSAEPVERVLRIFLRSMLGASR